MKELLCRMPVSERWPSGSARRFHVEITQLSSSQVRTADYLLPDGSADPFPTFSQPTDGRSPTVLELYGAHLNIYPPDPAVATETNYRGELTASDGRPVATQSRDFRFPHKTK